MPDFSPAFWKWFGASRVVDAHGQPLVVYHGTNANFKSFDPGRFGSRTKGAKLGGPAIYFTSSPEVARDYAQEEGSVFPVYLRIQNPLIEDAEGRGYRSYFPEIITAAHNYGHDGIILYNLRDPATILGADEPSTVFVVFKPSQIKSAVDNDGTWDADDPDIRSNPGAAFIRFEHRDGLGLMNNSGLERGKLSDDDEFELDELLGLGLRQPVAVAHGAIFAFTPEGVKTHARLIKLLRKASKTGVRKILLDPAAYRVVWQSGDGQVALVPA